MNGALAGTTAGEERVPPPARHRIAAAVLAAVLGATLAGCGGIPLDDSPRVIPRESLPEALVEPTTTLPPGVDPGTGGIDADLFLFLDSASDQVLIPCAVPTSAGGSVEARARAVVERLVTLDPDESELCPNDLTNAVPSNLVVLSVRLVVERDGNVLELNLDRESLSGIEATQQRRAIAQLVFTATDVPGVSALRFLADGEPISVPVEDRTADPGEAITVADFPALAQRTEEVAGPLGGSGLTTTTTAGP